MYRKVRPPTGSEYTYARPILWLSNTSRSGACRKFDAPEAEDNAECMMPRHVDAYVVRNLCDGREYNHGKLETRVAMGVPVVTAMPPGSLQRSWIATELVMCRQATMGICREEPNRWSK
jgi:hypothetical protein